MNRRHFIQSLTAGFAAVAIDPEQLLWTPGSRTIFLPVASKISMLDAELLERIRRRYCIAMAAAGEFRDEVDGDWIYWPPKPSRFDSRYLS